tara:strand:+ start:13996 stop:14577 length:582 start_codon:yes stop_codon:yes gene_type:complete
MNNRIFICGPSGVGKTTLANRISKVLDIPFISTSGKALWKTYNILSHKHLIEKTLDDPLGFGFDYQMELLLLRKERLKNLESFVTDRSPIDNLVYFISQLGPFMTENDMKQYMNLCEEALRIYTKGVFIPFLKSFPLEDDGARITNRYYQQYINNIFNLVIYEENYLSLCKPCIIKIHDWNLEYRLERVIENL